MATGSSGAASRPGTPRRSTTSPPIPTRSPCTPPPARSGNAATPSTSRWSPCGAALRQSMSSRCRSGHFLGTQARRPEFAVQRDPAVSVRTEVTASEAVITSGALSARFRRGDDWALEFVGGREGAHRPAATRRWPCWTSNRAVATSASSSAWRRRAGVRPRRAVRPGGEERPDRRHLERRRRHQQRAGVQERAVLPDQPRVTASSSTTRARSRSRSPPRRCRGCSSACPASRWSTWSSTGRRREEILRKYTGADRPAGAAAAVVVRAVAEHVVHHLLRRGRR